MLSILLQLFFEIIFIIFAVINIIFAVIKVLFFHIGHKIIYF